MAPKEVTLSDEQRAAVLHVLANKFTIVVGGPGAGKTTLITEIMRRIPGALLATPTGCSATRVKRATGYEAHVVSKIIWDTSFTVRYSGCTLIVDECSMVNCDDMYKLLLCIEPCRICLIGDGKQLPCVSGLPIFSVLLRCPEVPKCHLTINFRQRETQSGLVRTFTSLGTAGFTGAITDDNFKIFECESNDDAIRRASVHFMMNTNAQMLSMTDAGQKKLNALTAGSGVDRVVCMKNLYKKEDMLVANGVMGNLLDKVVTYENDFVDKMRAGKFASVFEMARCLTVHKSQGNEFDGLGIIVLTAWYGSVPLELMYTALSRFKGRVYVFGTKETIRDCLFGSFHIESSVHDIYIGQLQDVLKYNSSF